MLCHAARARRHAEETVWEVVHNAVLEEKKTISPPNDCALLYLVLRLLLLLLLDHLLLSTLLLVVAVSVILASATTTAVSDLIAALDGQHGHPVRGSVSAGPAHGGSRPLGSGNHVHRGRLLLCDQHRKKIGWQK